MKTLRRSILILSATVAAGFGQQWEFGGTAGGGFLNTVPVTSSVGTATAGFKSGAAFGGYIGFNQYKHIGGELHYNYLQSDLSLKSGGNEASFSGGAHVVGYDVIFKTTRNNGKVQLFAAVGGGVKVFRGTGKEAAYQPLSQYGYFTKTQAIKGMGDFGAGIKVALTQHVFLRTEFRDYITTFPTQVLTPPSGAKYGNVLHNLVPMVGIGYGN